MKEHPGFKMEVTFMGVLDDEMYDLIIQYGLTDIIKIISPVPYKDSLLLLSQYHLAIVIEASCEEGIFCQLRYLILCNVINIFGQ